MKNPIRSITIILGVGVLVSSACAHTPASTPPPATPTPGNGPIEMGTIESKALAGNLLGDPSTRHFFVYLPPGYEVGEGRYPVVYMLHGFTRDASSLTTDVKAAEDQLAVLGDGNGLIVVFPDCTNQLGGCQYHSSPTIGDYETYLVRELVAQVDATYRTLPNRASRAVAGCSMGGDGAAHLALKYPDVFGAFAAVAAAYDWEHDPNWEEARQGFTAAPQSYDDFKRHGLEAPKISWVTEEFLAVAAAASPDPNKPPFYLDMPFRMVNGEARIVPEVFQRVNALDPKHDLSTYLAQPIRLRGAMLYYGTEDTHVPVALGQSFDKALTEAGVDHTYLEVVGGHCSLDWTPVVQYLADHLEH